MSIITDIGEALFRRGGKAAVSAVDDIAEAAAKKAAPGLVKRVLFKQGGTGAIKKWPFLLTGLGAAGYFGNKAFGSETPVSPLTAEQISSAINMGTGDSGALSSDYFAGQRAALGSMYDTKAMRTQAQKNLEDYLANMNRYAQGQGAAISSAYGDLAAQARARAEETMRQSQMAATDIDRLYGAAAAQQAGLAGGQGISIPASEVSGLTGISGAAAETPDMSRTYGQSLADWMGRQGIINREDLAAAAQSYQAQGIGSRAQLEAEAAGLGNRARYDLNQQLIEAENAAQQQRAAALFNLQQQEQQAALAQQVEERQLQQQAGLLALRSPELWNVIKSDKNQKATWNALGVTNATQLYQAITSNPRLAQLLVGVTGG